MDMTSLAGLFAAAGLLQADGPYAPTEANLKMREWFQGARFGLFIHWGLYSIPAGEWNGQKPSGPAEWILNDVKIPLADYEKLADRFNPAEFDPAEWCRLAKAAGMKYITITSKHHDGFALWDSKVSDWDIVDRTPYKKDILKMLADECKKQDLKLFFYHSHLDWHHPDYFPRGQTGHGPGRPERGEFARYLDYLDAQIQELCGGTYGEIAGIWFDGWWDQKKGFDWRLRKTYDLIHKLQPQALIGNNHHVAPFPGEDFQAFEKDLPGKNTAGFNAEAKIGDLPLEMCETTNNSWGYKAHDKAFKKPRKLIRLLAGAAGHDSNLLLNVGPKSNGRFPDEAVEQLRQIGEWTSRFGDSIYGTRGGPVPPQKWGVTTRRGEKVYVHVFDAAATHGEEIALPGLDGKILGAKLMKDGADVRFDRERATISLPTSSRDPIDTIVVLEVAR
jgi:alpha-L-fucosidase